MEDEITLKDLLIHFSRNIKKIMIVVVLCAFIFAIFGLYKGMEESNDATSNENQIAYQKALEVHNEEINYLKNAIIDAKEHKAELQEYSEHSIYYNIDSFQKAVKRLILYIEPNNQNSNMTQKIAYAYCSAYKTDTIYNGIEEILGKVTEPKYINEIIKVTEFEDSNILTIEVCSSEKYLSNKIADYIYTTLKEMITDTIGNHDVKILSETSFMEIDDALKKYQDKHISDIEKTEEDIANKMAELETRQKDRPQEVIITRKYIILKIITYCFLGALLGSIIMYLWLSLKMLTNNKVYYATNIKKYYDIDILGLCPNLEKQAGRAKSLINKLIDSSDNPLFNNLTRDENVKLIASEINIRLLKQSYTKKLIFTGTGDYKNIESVANELTIILKKYIPDLEIMVGASILSTHSTIDLLCEPINIILVEKRGETYINQLSEQVNRIRKYDQRILGIILQ